MYVLHVTIYFKLQECIPVGCVPPACCPYLPACTAPGGVPGLGSVSGQGGVPGPGGTWSGGCTWSQVGVPGLGVYLVWGVYLPRYSLPHLPVNRMTDRCKNITLPQTSFAGGNKEKKQYTTFGSVGSRCQYSLVKDVLSIY